MLHFAPRHALILITPSAASKTDRSIISSHTDYNGHSIINVIPSPVSSHHPSINIDAEERRGDPKDETATASEEDAADEHGKK